MESMSWFRNLARFNPPRAQESEKAAAYSHFLQTSDESSISDEENPLNEEDSQSTKRCTINRVLILFTKTLLIFLALWGLITLGRTSVNKLHPAKPTSCSCGGTTVAEAISRGCIFTPLALAWLPPHCLDLELSDEFDALKPWPYYADRNGTIPLTREEMGLLADVDGVFYTTQEWHIMHCMFTWRKHYRSKKTGTVIENRSNGIKHIHHCEGIVLDRVPLEGIWTVAGVELNADLG